MKIKIGNMATGKKINFTLVAKEKREANIW